jgi:hydroxylamine oxidation protein HaoB
MSKVAIMNKRVPWRGGPMPLIGGAFILAGAAWMAFGPQIFSGKTGGAGQDEIEYVKLAAVEKGEPGFPQFSGRFPVERVERYRVGREGGGVELSVARYRDGQGRLGAAILFPPASAQGDGSPRNDLWQDAAQAAIDHTPANALFVGWWDDAQRFRFLSGREVWLDRPEAGAFADRAQRQFWERAGGGMGESGGKLTQLARWLSMDADAALREMAQTLPRDRPVYFLLCLDDLARLSEIAALSGAKLPFEGRIFPRADNIHAQIAEVKRWAAEKSPNAYLAQQLPNGGARAWRIAEEGGAKTLLARLLPFTGSLEQPLAGMTLVYQSGWGGYLSVYQWRP